MIDKTHTISIKELHEISIIELRDSKQLSVRASNGCLYGGLHTLYDIVQYYQTHNSFLDIRNVGRNSSLELEEFCNKIISLIDYDVVQVESDAGIDDLIEEQNTISDETKEFIKNNLLITIEEGLVKAVDFFNYVDIEKKELLIDSYNALLLKHSVRTANRLKEVGCENFIVKYLFGHDDALLDIKHLGKKSQTEAINFKNEFKEEIARVLSMTKMDLEIEKFLKDNNEIFKDDFIYDFYIENKYLPMFWRLEKEYSLERNERDMDIFLNSYPVFNNNVTMTLNELAVKHNITRERVRQIRNKILEKKIGDVLKNIKEWEFYISYLKDEKIIWSNGVIISKLLEKENCNLSTSFAFILLSELCKETYTLFEEQWSKPMLIHKAYADFFDFDKLLEDLDTIISNNDSEFFLNLDDYVLYSSHWLDFKTDKKNDVVLIVKEILLFEFGLLPEAEGRIKIPANKEKKPHGVVYEILKHHDKPMHINEIFNHFKQILPSHHYKQPSQLRPILQQHDKISYRSRKSVYMLAEWKHIKPGTIRNCITEFLEIEELPQSVSTITEHVLQYFPKTNASSVRTTMRNAPHGQYVFYNNDLFGLKGKSYPSHYIVSVPKQNKRTTFEQRLLDLEKFVISNKHFPFSTSDKENEVSLYRWWSRIISGKQQLSESQKNEAKRVREEYSEYNIDRNTFFWYQDYNKCKSFLLVNKRQPKSTGKEKALYGWLRRVKDDFENNNLNEDQRIKYIELTKLM